MDLLKPGGWILKSPRGAGAQITGYAALAAAVAGFGAAAALLPGPLVLPAVSAGMMLLACAIALVAWKRPADERGLTYWDVTGALAFLGICAALLSDPEHALPLMENARRSD